MSLFLNYKLYQNIIFNQWHCQKEEGAEASTPFPKITPSVHTPDAIGTTVQRHFVHGHFYAGLEDNMLKGNSQNSNYHRYSCLSSVFTTMFFPHQPVSKSCLSYATDIKRKISAGFSSSGRGGPSGVARFFILGGGAKNESEPTESPFKKLPPSQNFESGIQKPTVASLNRQDSILGETPL